MVARLVEAHIVGLDVAVEEAALVRVAQGGKQLAKRQAASQGGRRRSGCL